MGSPRYPTKGARWFSRKQSRSLGEPWAGQLRLERMFLLERRLLAGLIALVFLAVGCGDDEPAFPTAEEVSQLTSLRKLRTPPRSPTNQYADSAAAAALGKKLFADPALSGCGEIACASCHVAPSFTLDTPLPPGCNGNAGRNAPTLLNVAFSDWLGWDGRKDSIWSQAMFPLLNHVEMAGEAPQVRALLTANYAADYQAAFGKSPSAMASDDAVLSYFGKAIEAYERTLIRVDAPFDDQLDSFLAAAQAGRAAADPFFLPLKTFLRNGQCIVCHKGPMLSDGLFHNVGLKQSGTDRGRFAALPGLLDDQWNGAGAYSDDKRAGDTKLASLKTLTDLDTDGAFKTPTLRNIGLTAPYMHSGAVATLAEVIEFYDRGGDEAGTFPGTRAETMTKLQLSTEEKAALVTLLESLTGSETPE